MKPHDILYITCLVLSLYRESLAGYCKETYSCKGTCTKQQSYKKKCGLFGWKRCTRYRVHRYSCQKTCTRQKCCPGYTGKSCTTPLCAGITSCPNRGKCVAPDRCQCRPGYAQPRCADINECNTRNGGCAQTCVNVPGSHRCACRSGYILSPNLKSCIDVNECNKGGHQCQQKCTNLPGTFRCECLDGYALNSDKKTCKDVDECQKAAGSAGASKCDQICSNTIGSYTCSCRPGYQLALDKLSCEDIDECATGTATCVGLCINTKGSYRCGCNAGYQLAADGRTCVDTDECKDDPSICDQTCVNEPGSYRCDCRSGYMLGPDGRRCIDIDECENGISGCAHTCSNTLGSYTCSCRKGFKLGPDGKACLDIDDCVGVLCQNGGTCVDGLSSFTCTCTSGYTGKVCSSDINECSYLNGGCQDICKNSIGSFECSCSGNGTLLADGKSCKDSSTPDDIFRRRKIARKLLPKGCSMILLTRCTDGNPIDVYLSSTDDWYSLKSDHNILYTFGIVFAEVNDLSVPISLVGVEVHSKTNDFYIVLGVNNYTKLDGNIKLDKRINDDCLSFELTAADIYQFISSNSFLKYLFDKLFAALPDWAQLIPSDTDIIATQGLKTDLVYGRDMDNTHWCQGAPVLPNHLYSVFRFDANFTLSLYDNDITLPKPLNDNKFCLIVDICHNYGGSVFLMIPEESRHILTQLQVFKKLYEEDELRIIPRGLGISVVKGVNVHYKDTQMKLWNGDHLFTYPLFSRADLWIGGAVEKKAQAFTIRGDMDMFLSVPRPQRILTAVFIDEWNALVKVKASATATLKFKLFKKPYSITFNELGQADFGAYISIGGVNTPRKWCGSTSNPPGVFFTALISVNPFRTVPVLKDFFFRSTSTLYAFATSDPASSVTSDMKIDIKNDILQLQDRINRFETLLSSAISRLEGLITTAVKAILLELKVAVNNLKTALLSNLDQILQGNISILSNALGELWERFIALKKIGINFLDAAEFELQIAKDNFTEYLKNEMDDFKSNINAAITKLRNQVIAVADDYSGFGLKFRTSLRIFGISLFDIDLEFVYSVDSLMACSRFHEVSKLLEGQKAARILGRFSKKLKLGFFITAESGAGIGGALGVDTDKLIIQLNAYINLLGLKVTGDVFITDNRLQVYTEGNIWGLFLAQLDVSAQLGKEWYQLTFEVRGRFVANARKRRQTQVATKSFQGSYLDVLKKVVTVISDEVQKRLSQAQNILTSAQQGLTKAQNWLKSKKQDVRKANVVFDNAVAALGRAKAKLEQAKGPFKRALEKLRKAQKNVDNLCKIRKCGTFCIPGLKCKICHKKIWGVKIPYPCCRWTSCMIRLPNPICVAANLICRGIRAIAYVALEVAKIFVRVPMLALDLAKGVLSVAQVVVDKSRVVLKLAEGVLDLAVVGLEAAKGAMELAKISLEAVKKVIGIAAKVLEMVIEYGVKALIDVRNCEFYVKMSTTDLPVFDVSCEVNAFRLGWKKIGIRINFNNILQSLWQAAKATIDTLMKSLKGIFGRRRRRDISFEASSRINNLLREIRASGREPTEDVIRETISVINSTKGFKDDIVTDYDNRVLLFKEKCDTLSQISKFLHFAVDNLYDMVNETMPVLDEAEQRKATIHQFNIENITQTMTLETANISAHYAMKDYNLTEQDLQSALEKTKATFASDPLLLELTATAEFSKRETDEQIKSAESLGVLQSWIVAMDNATNTYFPNETCVGFTDCVFHSISTLYETFTEETLPGVVTIKEAISVLDGNMASLLGNASIDISTIHAISDSVLSQLALIDDTHVYCTKAPSMPYPMRNTTAALGTRVLFACLIYANPSPQYWWYKDGDMLESENQRYLVLDQVDGTEEGSYRCKAGNVVANLTSNEAFLTVLGPVTVTPDPVTITSETPVSTTTAPTDSYIILPIRGADITKAIKKGSRVVRGEDWAWRNQDGTPPGPGTVLYWMGRDKSTEQVIVKWDRGTQANYRVGAHGKYDLYLIKETTDTSTTTDASPVTTSAVNTTPDTSVSPTPLPTDAYTILPIRGADITKAIKKGARVVRGEDWAWRNQDGTPPGPGTVLYWMGRDRSTEQVIVKWDRGTQADYRVGAHGKYDLYLIKETTTPTTTTAASSVTTNPPTNISFTPDITSPSTPVTPVTTNPDRTTSDTSVSPTPLPTDSYTILPIRGSDITKAIKKGSRVVRGEDWAWGNQDGTPPGPGTVIRWMGKGKSSEQVIVKWDRGTQANYRVGAHGKYDLFLIKETSSVTTNPPSTTAYTGPTTGVTPVTAYTGPTTGVTPVTAYTGPFTPVTTMTTNPDLSTSVTPETTNPDTTTPNTSVSPTPLPTDSYTILPLRGADITKAIKKGSRVVRGEDWAWGNQDGTPPGPGTVLRWMGKGKSIEQVIVKWDRGTQANYRVGAHGKYDLYLIKEHKPV